MKVKFSHAEHISHKNSMKSKIFIQIDIFSHMDHISHKYLMEVKFSHKWLYFYTLSIFYTIILLLSIAVLCFLKLLNFYGGRCASTELCWPMVLLA
jgi:hypothetical protein